MMEPLTKCQNYRIQVLMFCFKELIDKYRDKDFKRGVADCLSLSTDYFLSKYPGCKLPDLRNSFSNLKEAIKVARENKWHVELPIAFKIKWSNNYFRGAEFAADRESSVGSSALIYKGEAYTFLEDSKLSIFSYKLLPIVAKEIVFYQILEVK